MWLVSDIKFRALQNTALNNGVQLFPIEFTVNNLQQVSKGRVCLMLWGGNLRLWWDVGLKTNYITQYILHNPFLSQIETSCKDNLAWLGRFPCVSLDMLLTQVSCIFDKVITWCGIHAVWKRHACAARAIWRANMTPARRVGAGCHMLCRVMIAHHMWSG